jgi:hypothetical protein
MRSPTQLGRVGGLAVLGLAAAEVLIMMAKKAYKDRVALEEALDAGVRLTPLVVVNVTPADGEVTGVRVPLAQNRWGPDVVMPLF